MLFVEECNDELSIVADEEFCIGNIALGAWLTNQRLALPLLGKKQLKIKGEQLLENLENIPTHNLSESIPEAYSGTQGLSSQREPYKFQNK